MPAPEPRLVPMRIAGGIYIDIRLPLLLDSDVDDLTNTAATPSDRLAYAAIAEQMAEPLKAEIDSLWKRYRVDALNAVARAARKTDATDKGLL